jgi:branched-subunit amino acid aminotransferase/4-amino-4-deoxychorismate lyase
MLAQDAASRAGADDALLVAPDGTVLEAPTSNVWFREADRLLTPSLDLPILAGVTRAALIELAPCLGYEVEEGAFSLDRLLAADEVFLSASLREVMPVVAVDGEAKESGPAAAALLVALRAAAGYPGSS